MWLISASPVGGNLPFELKAGEFDIGRSKECDIVILDSSVSPIHARLRVSPAGDLHLADLGSRNGTVVNNGRVSAGHIGLGDSVHLGAVSLHFASDRSQQGALDEPEEESILPVSSQSPKKTPADAGLTRHQKEVLHLIAQGLTEEEVADVVGRSYHTIHRHLMVLFRHFGVHSKQKLIAKLNEHI